MTERILITGASGFMGGHMSELLKAQCDQVDIIGTDIVEPVNGSFDRFRVADMCNAKTVSNIIVCFSPDYVIHLAGTFGVKDVQVCYRVNVLSMTALLEAIREHAPSAIVVAIGSAAEYGNVAEDQLPIREHMPCCPIVPYGISKLLATQVAIHYHRTYDVRVVIVRPFQLIGKGITSRLAPGAFVTQLKQAISEGNGVLKVGNLESSRDFLDIHDAVTAIWALCQKPVPGEIFNVCSGKAVRIADLIQMMIDVSRVRVRIEVDQTRLRGRADVSKVYGSYQKIKNHCGWQPERSLSQSLEAMLEGW